jgi:hypothetical protein
MPDGDHSERQVHGILGNYGQDYKLLDNDPYAAATSNVYTGPACDVSTLKYASAQVDGTFTGTVNIEGTNDSNTATANWYPLCTAPTAAALVALTMPIRYARARVSSFTAGSVSVSLHGVA